MDTKEKNTHNVTVESIMKGVNKIANDNAILLEKLAQKDSEISELKSKNRDLSYAKTELKTKEKQLEKYKNILNLTPGTDITKVKLLEYFTNEVIPHISEKIGSKYTEKIIEYLDKEIVNKSKEEEEEKLYTLVLGTSLEFLYPYLRCGYITDIDYKTLKSYIKNPSSLAFYNWKKDNLPSVMELCGNLSCPIYSNREIGIHNSKAFNESCLNDLLNYILCKYRQDFMEHVTDHFKEILGSAELRRKYGLSVKAETLDINENERVKRDTVIRFLKKKGLLYKTNTLS